MNINTAQQILVGDMLYPLVAGQPLKIQVGQTVRVLYSFSYKVVEATSVPVWASLYTYTAGILNRLGQAQTKSTITLDKSLTWQTYQGQIDIAVGKMNAGVYGLIVELPGFTGAEAKADNAIDVAAAAGLTDIIAPVLVIAVMGMLASSFGGMSEESK